MAERVSAVSAPTDRELIERWIDEPAPLLGLLHAFHERDGFVSDAALREVAFVQLRGSSLRERLPPELVVHLELVRRVGVAPGGDR